MELPLSGWPGTYAHMPSPSHQPNLLWRPSHSPHEGSSFSAVPSSYVCPLADGYMGLGSPPCTQVAAQETRAMAAVADLVAKEPFKGNTVAGGLCKPSKFP